MTIEPGDVDLSEQLRSLTHARVGLGRSGSSLPTDELLRLRADQIHAADSVRADFDADKVIRALEAAGLVVVEADTLATDKQDYLQHPDHGRTLTEESRARLRGRADQVDWDVVFIVSDGLSTQAATTHSATVVTGACEALLELDPGLQIAPVVVAPRARVGLLNDAGAAIAAKVAVILLGERPGLSASDGLSAYLEYDPAPGRTDADRNCISNIRHRGLEPQQAARNVAWLIIQALREGISGTGLKVEYSHLEALDEAPSRLSRD